MIAAEKWYEYQENYQKYGLDMKPKQPRKKIQPRKQTVSSKDKAKLLIATVLIGVLFIGVVVTTAYAAAVQYSINQTVQQNGILKAEIQALNVKIYSANSIETIENAAMKDLGMIYPKSKQRVYLDKAKTPGDNFASKLKEKAYN
ncbi:MAG: hypothetical protein RSD88_06680 [Anaerovoracaceae bacterium]